MVVGVIAIRVQISEIADAGPNFCVVEGFVDTPGRAALVIASGCVDRTVGSLRYVKADGIRRMIEAALLGEPGPTMVPR
jgi:hypothetical protein